MKKIIRILGLAMVLTVILVVALAGTAFAKGPGLNVDKSTQTQNQGEVCPCGDCVCGDCVPNEYNNDYNWDWSNTDDPSGPHGPYTYGNVEE